MMTSLIGAESDVIEADGVPIWGSYAAMFEAMLRAAGHSA
jgi:hypothetical protein